MLAAKLAEHGIRLKGGYGIGSQKIQCPHCGKRDTSLSVTITDDGALWKCHRCEWSGAVRDADDVPAHQFRRAERPKAKPGKIEAPSLSADHAVWFKSRGIELEALRRAGVGSIDAWIPAKQASVPSIVFPYRAEAAGPFVNAKYRTLDKDFAQAKNGEKVFWLLDQADIEYGDQLVICEGEMDALSLLQADIANPISVPDGAPRKVKDGEPVDPEDDRKFSYVWAQKDRLAEFSKIILATDGDEPGIALAEELSRRLGKERCWTVRWPEGCKDANDVLMRHGVDALRDCIAGAEPHPIRSLIHAKTYRDEVVALYRLGRRRGASTGWANVDEFYSVAPGQLTVVTGVPNSGKSEWIDALVVNLAEAGETAGKPFPTAICSFENPPDEHITKLVEKRMRKPFWDGPTQRMTEADLVAGMEWVEKNFCFIRSDDEAQTIDWLLETATGAVLRYGIRGLIIDPYNEVEHKRDRNQTETEYVSLMLGKVKRWALNHGVHVWFIAHPAKMLRENGKIPVPTLYDISGSANWVNKADAGIVVHRNPAEPLKPTEIHVRKIRFKWVGKQGSAMLDYNKAVGRYTDHVMTADETADMHGAAA